MHACVACGPARLARVPRCASALQVDGLDAPRARALFDAGLRTPADALDADDQALKLALCKALPLSMQRRVGPNVQKGTEAAAQVGLGAHIGANQLLLRSVGSVRQMLHKHLARRIALQRVDASDAAPPSEAGGSVPEPSGAPAAYTSVSQSAAASAGSLQRSGSTQVGLPVPQVRSPVWHSQSLDGSQHVVDAGVGHAGAAARSASQCVVDAGVGHAGAAAHSASQCVASLQLGVRRSLQCDAGHSVHAGIPSGSSSAPAKRLRSESSERHWQQSVAAADGTAHEHRASQAHRTLPHKLQSAEPSAHGAGNLPHQLQSAQALAHGSGSQHRYRWMVPLSQAPAGQSAPGSGALSMLQSHVPSSNLQRQYPRSSR
jgi:hypothetical protein